MQQRSPALVFFLSLITFGIYALVWQVKTKGELNRLGANIPSAWLIIVPLANLYWIWKYCEGVEQVSHGQISAVLALILLLLLSIVGLAILQSEFNKLSVQPAGPVPGPGAAPQPQQFGATTINPSQPGPVPPTYPAQPADNDPTGPPSPPPAPPAPPSPPLPPSPIQ
jgi:hypothetical protein